MPIHARQLFSILIACGLAATFGPGCPTEEEPPGDDDSGDDDSGDDDSGDDDSGDDDSGDDDSGDDDTGPEPLFPCNITFDDYALGQLPEPPWMVVGEVGVSDTEVVTLPTRDGSGQGLMLSGGTTLDDWAWVDYYTEAQQQDIRIDMDVMLEAGAAFGFFVYSFPGFQMINLTEVGVLPGGSLGAWDFGQGSTSICGKIVPDTWHQISVVMHYDSGTYDVLFDGAATACTGLASPEPGGTKYGGFGIFDPDNEGYGGVVYFDNIVGTNP